MAGLAGSEGYQAVPSADYELVSHERAESSGGGPAPDAAHSDAAHVAAADAAVRKATARLWLTADCLACVLFVMGMALFIAGVCAEAIVYVIVPGAIHAGARWRGSNSALNTTLLAHMMAPFLSVCVMFKICVISFENGTPISKLDNRLAGLLAIAYCVLAFKVMAKSLTAWSDFKDVAGTPGWQPGKHACIVGAARVQRDVDAARSQAASYRQEREAAARRQLKLRLEAAELRALEAFEAAKAQAPDGKLSCPWKAPGAHWPDSSWERWRAAADRLQLFNTDPDAYIQQHGYYGCY